MSLISSDIYSHKEGNSGLAKLLLKLWQVISKFKILPMNFGLRGAISNSKEAARVFEEAERDRRPMHDLGSNVRVECRVLQYSKHFLSSFILWTLWNLLQWKSNDRILRYRKRSWPHQCVSRKGRRTGAVGSGFPVPIWNAWRNGGEKNVGGKESKWRIPSPPKLCNSS